MPIKCKSDQIRTECYDYTCIAGLNYFYPIKARPGEVIVVHLVSVYNNSGANYGACYKVIKTGGQVCHLNYTASINNGVVQRWATDIYLASGDEGGIAITPNAAGESVQAIFQIIRMRDDEYFKAT